MSPSKHTPTPCDTGSHLARAPASRRPTLSLGKADSAGSVHLGTWWGCAAAVAASLHALHMMNDLELARGAQLRMLQAILQIRLKQCGGRVRRRDGREQPLAEVDVPMVHGDTSTTKEAALSSVDGRN